MKSGGIRMTRLQFYIDDARVDPVVKKSAPVINPATEEATYSGAFAPGSICHFDIKHLELDLGAATRHEAGRIMACRSLPTSCGRSNRRSSVSNAFTSVVWRHADTPRGAVI